MDVYIDESGNLGEKSNDRFFVITAVCFLKPKRIKNIIKRFKVRKSITELKGSLCDVVDRQYLLNRLNSKNDYFISYIILDKKNLEKKKLFEDSNILFNYLCSFLFKKMLRNSQEKINLFFDNRVVKVASGNSLYDYMRIKAYTEWNFSGDIQVQYLDSHNSHLIQMADFISNTIYQSYRYGKSHFYKMLKINDPIRFPQNRFGM